MNLYYLKSQTFLPLAGYVVVFFLSPLPSSSFLFHAIIPRSLSSFCSLPNLNKRPFPSQRPIDKYQLVIKEVLRDSEHDSKRNNEDSTEETQRNEARYVLGKSTDERNSTEAAMFWSISSPVKKPTKITTSLTDPPAKTYDSGHVKNTPERNLRLKKMIANDAESQFLSRALWRYGGNKDINDNGGIISEDESGLPMNAAESGVRSKSKRRTPPVRYEDIDLSIPPSVYNNVKNIDHVWSLLRDEAEREAEKEPLLVSFLHSTILTHSSLESSLAFHLANRLSSPSMMSTQIMSLIMEALSHSPTFRRDLRADIMAVRDRDPACRCLPDVFLHFKGFHALEAHRVANFFFATGRQTLAHYLQSQVSQNFQIDIHPNATLGRGIMLDHGTGIVIGETAVVGENCSILHHVTLGGSGKKGVDRHPKVGNGVLLGAGASVLGNIKIGDGCQVGAGTLVLQDLKPHTVAVGVPAKIIGKFQDEEAQPGRSMYQLGTKESEAMIRHGVGDGI